MDVLVAVIPVLVMITIGVLCRHAHLVSRVGVTDLKQIVVKIMLPVAIFQALGTAEYTVQTIAIIAMFLAVIIISFLAGFGLRYFIKPPQRKYVPFLVSVYEGGMMGYPLYTSLCGAENLSNIALLDIACLLFGFSVYMGLLQQTETGERFNGKVLILSALKNPAFLTTVLGIVVGATGLLNALLTTSFGEVYSVVQSIVTAGLSALVLLMIGYDFSLSVHLIVPCLKTIACRVVLQAALAVCMIAATHALFGPNRLLDIAIIMLMAAPAPFSMQSYLKTEDGGNYVSTVNSLYCVVTIIVYIVLAFLI